MKLLLFNVQNKYRIEHYKGIYRNKDTVVSLANYVKENNIDILCLQEVLEIYRDRLIDNLDSYHAYGKPRLGDNFFTRKIEKLKRFNESVNIITKLDVSLEKTINLPNLPDFLPRIVTMIEVKYESKTITILNTHLSAYNKISKKRQLKYLLKIIKDIKKPVILTGDFNMNIKSDILNGFIEELAILSINHLEIAERTFKKSKRNLPIDHIFVSNSLRVKSLEVIKDKDVSFSDHYPILLEIKKNILDDYNRKQ